MFHRFLVTILSFGLFGNVIYGRCISEDCDDKDLRGKQKHQSSRSARFSPRNCHYYITKFCSDFTADNCNPDKNIISSNCWNCCCKQLSLLPTVDDSDNSEGDATLLTTGCEPSSTDCNPKGTEDSNTSRERDLSATLSTAESETKCPSLPSCPSPPSCPSSCPTTSNAQRFSRDSDTQLFNKNFTLSVLPENVPIIPSPQLDLLTSGGSLAFSNIQDLHLSTIKPPLAEKPLMQGSVTHDCCTRCRGVNCIPRNSNAIILGASTFMNRRNRETKCKSKELGRLMMANIKRDPSRSKRAIQRAAEQKFSAQFNVICSKGDFSYVTHTTEYCEVINRDW
ncbi:Ground-like domain family protein [Acanthocheilonema viteae]